MQFYFVALGVSPFISAKKLFTFQKNYLLHSERLQFYFIFISNRTPSSLILKSFKYNIHQLLLNKKTCFLTYIVYKIILIILKIITL